VDCGVSLSNWQKKKPRDLLDLKVIDVFEGLGQFQKMLGGVIVHYVGSDGNTHEVKVGSGFSKNERMMYWKNKNKILTAIIKVATDGESSNDSGGLSFRFPVFKGVKHDK
jgi:DNA ligase-1